MTKITINPLLVAILFITSVCSCDRFRVNICQANLDYESCIIPAGSSDPTEANRFDMSMRTSATDLAGPTNGTKFKNVGNIDLAPAGYQQRFAGSLSGGSIMFMRNTHNTLIEYRMISNTFVEQAMCSRCRFGDFSLDWNNDTVYTANDTMVRVRKEKMNNSVCTCKGTDLPLTVVSCNNDTLLTMRPAISFLGNGFSYGLSGGIGESYQSRTLFNNMNRDRSFNNMIIPTFVTIGSIYTKTIPAALELLYFNDSGLLSLDSLESFNTIPLETAIQTAMNSTTAKSQNLNLILGADIADINTDNQAELLYIRGKKVFAITIRNTGPTSNPMVESWHPEMIDLVDVLGADSIKSLRAVDINGDSRPDLAVETDRRVLFYLNQAQ